MKYKQRIRRGPQRPSLFRSPLFYVVITALISFITFYQFAGKAILRELGRKNPSLHLRREGEALNHLLYHQFFILGLKKDDVKLTLKKVEKDNISWNLYQIEILLPPHLPCQRAGTAIENEVKLTFPALSFSSHLRENGAYEVTIQQESFTLGQLTFISPPVPSIPSLETKPALTGIIAIVIDDLGPNLTLAREFLAIPYPLTFSILPFYAHSKEITTEVHSQGREIMLHLPLEPLNNEENKPEKGILYTSMDEDKLLAHLREDLSAVPFLRGANGHMGSKFTEDKKSMGVVFRELKIQGLFFLDSLTTAKSVGLSVAGETGTAYGRRDLFLDRDLEGKTIEERLIQLAELSKKRGYAIGIVHPYSDTLNALKKILPVLASEGVQVVPVSEVINHSAQKP